MTLNHFDTKDKIVSTKEIDTKEQAEIGSSICASKVSSKENIPHETKNGIKVLTTNKAVKDDLEILANHQDTKITEDICKLSTGEIISLASFKKIEKLE